MDREDSVISTFHVPPLARGKRQCDIVSLTEKDIVQKNSEQYQKHGKY